MGADCEKCYADMYEDENGFYCPICRYEQEISELKSENARLKKLNSYVSNGEHINKEWIEQTVMEYCDDMMKKAYSGRIGELEREIAELRECVEHYADLDNECCGDYQPPNRARACLEKYSKPKNLPPTHLLDGM